MTSTNSIACLLDKGQERGNAREESEYMSEEKSMLHAACSRYNTHQK